MSPYKRPTDVSVLIFVVLIITLSLSASYSGIGIARADSVIATIPVGHEPFGIAFDSSNAYLYATNYLKNGSVSVISGQTNTIVGNPIPVGRAARCCF